MHSTAELLFQYIYLFFKYFLYMFDMLFDTKKILIWHKEDI